MRNLFTEFRRRNVFRVAALYLVVAWLLLQVSLALESSLYLPDWFDSMVAALLILGLPIALICAWAFELTPDGFKRTEKLGETQLNTLKKSNKLEYVLLASMFAILASVGSQHFFNDTPDGLAFDVAKDAAKEVGASHSKHTPNNGNHSIAVLPFTDLSPNKDQEYFADGISEEILNVLSQEPDLNVAGRTSSFAFKGRNEDLREIGKALGVAHILEGSVRKDGENIRVTAQLIEVEDGFHLWSETYDRKLVDIFSIQDDVAAQIFSALTSTLMGKSRTLQAAPLSANTLEAYELYLLARQRIYTREKSQLESAVELLDRAIALDPGYAPAYAQRALSEVLLSDDQQVGGKPVTQASVTAATFIDKALELDPNLAESLGIKGLILDNLKDHTEAENYLRRALEINPNLNSVRNWLANHLKRSGRINDAIKVYEEASLNDPLFPPVLSNLTMNYVFFGQGEKARALVDRIRPIVSNDELIVPVDALLLWGDGEFAEGLKLLKQSYERGHRNVLATSLYAGVLYWLGAYEEAIKIDFPHITLSAMLELGRVDEATKLAKTNRSEGNSEKTVVSMAEFYLRINKPEIVVESIDKKYQGIENYIKEHPQSEGMGSEKYAAIALCYRRVGRADDALKALEFQVKSDASQRSLGANSGFVTFSEATNAALTGNTDLAFAKLQETIDLGVPAANIQKRPYFESLHTDPRWAGIVKQFMDIVNVERIKYGLEPLSLVE